MNIKCLILGASALSLAVFSTPVRAQYPQGAEKTFCVAELRSQDRQAQINLRSGPGTDRTIAGYGVPGDLVHILGSRPPEPDASKDSQGFLWYRVGFPHSGAVGWMRSDLLERYCLYDNGD